MNRETGTECMRKDRTVLRDLSRCEQEIMAEIWRAGGICMQEIRERVNGGAWKPQTVSTFLSRLKDKGYVSVTNRGRSAYYSPVVNLDDYLAKLRMEYEDFRRAAGAGQAGR